MEFDTRFRIILPPLVETVSSLNQKPCTAAIQSDEGGEKFECPHEKDCRTLAQTRAPRKIEEAYGCALRVTLSEISTSIVVRSEHQYSQDNQHRFAIRKHLFELLSPPDGAGAPGSDSQYLSCKPTSEGEQFGQYVGFVDLRPKSRKSPVAMAILAPPRRYTNDPDTFVITGNYGTLVGGSAFASSIYLMNEPGQDGSSCAQSCMIMALGMLSDRRAKVLGSYTLTYLGRTHKSFHDLPTAEHDPECLRVKYRGWHSNFFNIDGLNPRAVMAVLTSPHCRVCPFLGEIRDRWANALAIRVLEGYVTARFPVILSVRSAEWFGKKEYTDNHAVLIVGIRQRDGNIDDASLIIHDPATKPFAERPAKDCFAAAMAYPPLARSASPARGRSPHINGNAIPLIAVADENIRVDAVAFAHEVLNKDSLLREFVRKGLGAGRDFRIRLLSRDDVGALLPIGSTLKERTSLAAKLAGEKVGPGRQWCIAAYEKDDANNTCVRRMWIMDAETAGLPLVVIDFPPGQTPTLDVKRAISNAKPPSTAPKPASSPIDATTSTPTANSSVPPHVQRLECSVITGSTGRPVREFVKRVRRINGIHCVDLLVLRDQDIRAMQDQGVLKMPIVDTPILSAAQVLETADPEALADWYAAQLPRNVSANGERFRVAALATYLPQITSRFDRARKSAIRGLANAMRIAIILRDKHKLLDQAIVEIVCGTLSDRCDCRDCTARREREAMRREREGASQDLENEEKKKHDIILVAEPRKKIELLMQALRESIELVGLDKKCFIALELEPGPTYVLNNAESLRAVMEAVANADASVRSRVGLNIDVAHMRIAGVTAADIAAYSDRILHAHIADHPYFHTRDQLIGSWTSVECDPRRDAKGFYPYLRLLSQRMAEPSAMPFSGALALELEGCDRIFWVHHSLNTMKYLLETISP